MASARPSLVVVDDDEEILRVITDIGRRAGFDVDAVASAAALEPRLAADAPDVLVLDLQMPGTDGIEVLRRLADVSCRSAIVLVSGMDQRTISSAEQYASIRRLTVAGSIQKPFVPDELNELLAAARSVSAPLTGEDLEQAIRRSELEVYYQPTIRRFADGTWDISSVEALLRWNHPVRGLVTADAFIEMGEREGLMRAMTDFVLQAGIERLKGWQAQRLDVGLRVNVAASLITDVDFPDRLQAVLEQYEVAPSALTIEITETATLDQAPETLDILTRLRVKEINLALDDFGGGYSSLTQLFRMPFNEMKIDRSLTGRIPSSREACIMIEALIDLAHKLNLAACAEGVESEAALEFLARAGCDSAQGYHIGRPIQAREVSEMIHRWDRRERISP